MGRCQKWSTAVSHPMLCACERFLIQGLIRLTKSRHCYSDIGLLISESQAPELRIPYLSGLPVWSVKKGSLKSPSLRFKQKQTVVLRSSRTLSHDNGMSSTTGDLGNSNAPRPTISLTNLLLVTNSLSKAPKMAFNTVSWSSTRFFLQKSKQEKASKRELKTHKCLTNSVFGTFISKPFFK